MLDVFYPSWSALIANLREIRAYLRTGNHNLPDKASDYSLSKIRGRFNEEIYFVDGVPTVCLVCHRIA